jgi:Flp pilus assembly pilin Flp
MHSFAAAWTNTTAVACRFACDTHAATAIEYAMIAAGVGAAIAGTVYNLGSTIQNDLYNKIASAMN